MNTVFTCQSGISAEMFTDIIVQYTVAKDAIPRDSFKILFPVDSSGLKLVDGV
jgi:hypothetical protein